MGPAPGVRRVGHVRGGRGADDSGQRPLRAERRTGEGPCAGGRARAGHRSGAGRRDRLRGDRRRRPLDGAPAARHVRGALPPGRLRALHEWRNRDQRGRPGRHGEPPPPPRGHGVGIARGSHHPQLGIPTRPGPRRRRAPRLPVQRRGAPRVLPGARARGRRPPRRARRGRHRLGRAGDRHDPRSRAGQLPLLGARLQRPARGAGDLRRGGAGRHRGRAGRRVPRLQGRRRDGLGGPSRPSR